MFSDRYGNHQEIQYQGPEGKEAASRILAAALVWVAESLSQRTFDGLVQAETRENGYRIKSPNALASLAVLVQIMAEYRSKQRIQQAA